MFITELDIGITPLDICYCWGMCKQTVIKETKHYDRYGELTIAEFLEFFARIANRRLPDEAQPLEEKIAIFMDTTYPALLNGAKRIEVSTEIEEESESDDDYGKELIPED